MRRQRTYLKRVEHCRLEYVTDCDMCGFSGSNNNWSLGSWFVSQTLEGKHVIPGMWTRHYQLTRSCSYHCWFECNFQTDFHPRSRINLTIALEIWAVQLTDRTMFEKCAGGVERESQRNFESLLTNHSWNIEWRLSYYQPFSTLDTVFLPAAEW